MVNLPWKYGGSISKIRDLQKKFKISTFSKTKKCHDPFLLSIVKLPKARFLVIVLIWSHVSNTLFSIKIQLT